MATNPIPQPPTSDDSEIEGIIQRMMDAGESDESIAQVVKEYDTSKLPGSPGQPPGKLAPYKGPTDYDSGWWESIKSGEAVNAGLRGAKGYLKGAITDIPSTIVGGLQGIGNAIAHPIDTVTNLPSNLANAWEGAKETYSKAGSDPEAWGRMMGQVTGQPITTPAALKLAPHGVAAVGKGIKTHTPASGLLPPWMKGPTLPSLERGFGRGLQAVGEGMANEGIIGYPARILGEAGGQLRDLVYPRKIAGEVVPDTWGQGVPTGTVRDVTNQQRPQIAPTEPVNYGQPPYSADVQSPTAGRHMNTPPPPGPPPPPQLPPGRGEPIVTPIPADPMSPTAGAHMNSPAQPHNIPPGPPQAPAPPPVAAKPTPAPSMGISPNEMTTPFGRDITRYYELVDKGNDGTLTAIEMNEAQVLSRKLREAAFDKETYNRSAVLREAWLASKKKRGIP